MLRTFALSAVAALALAVPAAAQEAEPQIYDFNFSFEGPFGSFDINQLQRGLQVYTEVCSACHGLNYLYFRNLSDEGGPELPEEQMRAYAAMFEVWDPTLLDGEGDFRQGTPADHFPESSLSNAPDLTLMAKARTGFHGPYGTGINQLFKGMGGAEYIASLLAGYEEAPECAGDFSDGYYNTVFTAGAYPESCIDGNGNRLYPGSWIAMAPPLYGDDVVYIDNASTNLEDVSQDVAAFLMWAAEPKMMARKEAGLTGVIFLVVLSVLLYLTNKRLWAPHKRMAERDPRAQ